MGLDLLSGQSIAAKQFREGLQNFRNSMLASGASTLNLLANVDLIIDGSTHDGWIEFQKMSTDSFVVQVQKTPIKVGQYLEVSFSIRHVSGALARANICGLGLNAAGAAVSGLANAAPSVAMVSGATVRVSAVIGAGNRDGVDLAWGNKASQAHFGLQMTGSNNGIYKIESMQVIDVTGMFLAQNADWVDVRDFGALGDGVVNCRNAFIAADLEANGRTLLVPEGDYEVVGDLTLNSPVRFIGRLVMPTSSKLMLTENFDYERYFEAFKNETTALNKALQALYSFTDHDSLNLNGRRIELTGPIDVHSAVAGADSFILRRSIRNGQLLAAASSNWNTKLVTSNASYSRNAPKTLSNVVNITQIEIGSLVSGSGVGREIFVVEKNDVAKTITLSSELYGASGTQSFTFQRFRFMLDFSGFIELSRIELDQIEFRCENRASAVLLPKTGMVSHITHCWFEDTKDRAICSYFEGCNGICIETCDFRAGDRDSDAADRSSIAITTHWNDMKIRNNRAVKFRHFAVMGGSGHIISGNHFFQGNEDDSTTRTAGIVLTDTQSKTVFTGNYIDNSWIEITNERNLRNDFTPEDGPFGNVSITGNIFTANRVATSFNWVVLKPFGANYEIAGIAIIGNVFKKVSEGRVTRVDAVDTSFGSFAHTKTRHINFHSNCFVGIDTRTRSPAETKISVTTASSTWSKDVSSLMPFGGRCLRVDALSPQGALLDSGGGKHFGAPYSSANIGTNGGTARLHFSTAVKGTYTLRVASDQLEGD